MKSPIQPANPSAELAQILARKIPFEMVSEALFRALTATTVSRSGALEQDTASQLKAASLILENRVGRPVTRQEIVSVSLDADTEIGLKERLRSSPAMRAAMRQMLLEADETIDV
jgi:hypothetical protein